MVRSLRWKLYGQLRFPGPYRRLSYRAKDFNDATGVLSLRLASLVTAKFCLGGHWGRAFRDLTGRAVLRPQICTLRPACGARGMVALLLQIKSPEFNLPRARILHKTI